ncbi:hypothetical protein K1719_011204 [Acacia pycnantha]|nr:hypothetical protein K1719_011204 [Acacia pycnantha]
MATASSYFLGLTLCVVIGITMLCNFHGVSAQMECGGTPISELMAKCQQYIMPPGPKTQPSAECCSAIKDADMPCLCKHVTKEIEKIVSMDKVVYVCRTCGKDLPAGTQCGSYKVPPLMA